jgi:hypothetical protein
MLHLNFFVPTLALASGDGGVMKAIDIGAASSDHGDYLCMKPCRVRRLLFTPTEEAASGTTTAPTVVVTKRPTPGSSSGASAVGTITVPSGTAIGATVYKDIDPVQFEVGDTLHIAWTIGVGTPTGIGMFAAECEDSPEYPGNNSEMVASA